MDRLGWVEQHAKCDEESLFEEIYTLCKKGGARRIKEVANKPKWEKYVCEVKRDKPNTIVVHRYLKANPFDKKCQNGCVFTLIEIIGIKLHIDDPEKDQVIRTHWDGKKCRIHLYENGDRIDDRPYSELWEMVKIVLDPIFFPPTDNSFQV